MTSPSPNGANGRGAAGRFAKGNAGGPGNPLGKQVAALRAAMLAAVTPEDMKVLVQKLVQQAKDGNIAAAKEILDRCLGRPLEADLLERIEALEDRKPLEAPSWQG